MRINPVIATDVTSGAYAPDMSHAATVATAALSPVAETAASEAGPARRWTAGRVLFSFLGAFYCYLGSVALTGALTDSRWLGTATSLVLGVLGVVFLSAGIRTVRGAIRS